MSLLKQDKKFQINIKYIHLDHPSFLAFSMWKKKNNKKNNNILNQNKQRK